MRSAALWLIVAFLSFLPQLVRTQVADADLWGRISVGAVLFQAGHLPRVDDFSYTANGAAWIDHEWLSGVVFYAALNAFGEPGLLVLKYTLVGACFLLIFLLHGRTYRATPIASAAAIAAAGPGFLLGFLSSVRCQAFSFPLLLAFVTVLESVRLGRLAPRHLLWLVPAAALWANLHGGVAMGGLAVCAYAAAALAMGQGRAALRMLALLPGMGVAMALLNPYGVEYLDFLGMAWTLDRAGIAEWRPLFTGGLHAANAPGAVAVALAGVLALGGAWDALRRRLGGNPLRRDGKALRLGAPAEPTRPDALAPSVLLAGWIAMTLLAHRILPFLTLTLVAFLPLYARLWWPRAEPFARARRLAASLSTAPVAAAVLAVMGSAGAASWGRLSDGRPLLASVLPSDRTAPFARHFLYPDSAVRFLRESPYGGNLLNPFSQGEFLYWVLYPKFRVAIDGRFEEVYDRRHFREAYDFYHELPRQPERVVEFASQSAADFVLFRTTSRGFPALARDPGWVTIHRDASFAVLARKEVVEHDPPAAPARPADANASTIADFFDPGARRFADYP